MKTEPNRVQNFFIKSFGIDRYLAQWEAHKKIQDMNLFNTDKYRELENRVWYEGDPSKLEHFYKTLMPVTLYNSQNKFWRVVNSAKMPRLHYPLASMVSNAMSTLLFNQNPEFTVDAGSKSRNKELQKRLDEINDVNDIILILQSAASYQSYSGSVGLKINYDPTLVDVPLITTYPKEKIKVHSKYGQTIYIDFLDEYGEYKLVSRYGLGYINYMLFNKNEKKVPLNTIPETADLQDIAFFDNMGNIIPILFGAVINNKGKNADSDYKGLVDTFHALDEAYSSLNNYIRKIKPHVYLTEDLAPKDENGKVLPRSDFDDVITILDQAIGDNSTKIERDIIKIEVQGYIDTFNKYRMIALEKIGLSPATIGIDSGGANQSGDALNIRERASGRLRDEKLSVWKEQLDKFFYSVLMFDYIIHNSIENSQGIYTIEIPHDFVVISNFGEYIKQSLEERSSTYIKLFEKGMISVDFAIRQIFGNELSEEELIRLIIETKIEVGKPLSNIEQEWLNKQK